MKKKLMLYILTIFVIFIGINSVSAKNQIGYCSYFADGKYQDISVYSDKTVKFHGISYDERIWSDAVGEMYDNGSCYKYIFSSNSTLKFENEYNKPDGATTYMLDNMDENPLTCYYDVKAFNDEANPKYIRLKVKRNGRASRVYIYYMDVKKNYVALDLSTNSWTVESIYGEEKDGDNGIITYYVDKTPANVAFKIDNILDLFELVRNSSSCPKLLYEKWSDGTSTMVTIYPKTDYEDLDDVYASGSCKYGYKDGTVSEGNVSDAGARADNEKILCERNGSIIYDDKTVKFNFRIKTEDGKVKWCAQIDGGYQCTGLSIKQALPMKVDDLNGHSQVKFQPDDELWDYLKEMEAGTKTACPSYIGGYYTDVFGSAGTGDMSSGTYMLTMDKDKATFDLSDGRTVDPGGTRHTEAVEEAKRRGEDNPGTDIDGCQLIGPNTLAFLNSVLNVIMIAGPIIGVLLGTYELITAMASGDDDARKKGIKRLQNRLIASALLLLVPYIVKFILNVAGRSTSADCIDAMQNLVIIRSNLF